MQREPIIYLDMDGVVVAFVTAGIQAAGHDPRAVLKRWSRDYRAERRTHRVLGIRSSEFWRSIGRLGEAFWGELEAYPWFRPLYDGLREIAPVVFLSSPSLSPFSLSGKLRWLQRHFGQNYREYVFTAHKSLLAHERALLVDDFRANTEAFVAAGGSAVLLPRVWNAHHAIEDPVAYTLDRARASRDALEA